MAHSLNDLIISLATILIRYHDSQKINVCIKENEPAAMKKAAREYAMKLLQSEDFDQEFARLNVECTKQYADFKRIDLLTFIKDEIKILKEVSLRTTPFQESDDESTNSEFNEYKNKIAMLLTDFKGLLNTQKTSVYEARIKKFNDPIVTKLGLHGMIDSVGVSNMFGMLKSSPLCNSGDLVKVELLDRFNLTELSTSSEIRMVAEHICEGHQHALMAARHRELQTTILELKEQHGQERTRFEHELALLEKKLQEKEEKLLELQNSTNELQRKIEAEAQARKILEGKLKEAEDSLQESKVKISEQETEIQRLQLEVKTLKEEKGRQPFTSGIVPPFYVRPSQFLFYQNFQHAVNPDSKQPGTANNTSTSSLDI
ncbi:hypothetical protein [Legionella saoudiensis]|uniref:hypothetical protein n=1 Tax=Legionella saoudiensis TaxID=1750561 RepID=UPI000730F3F5|nr:hypothetical protein [Legionella saoudiensis]